MKQSILIASLVLLSTNNVAHADDQNYPSRGEHAVAGCLMTGAALAYATRKVGAGPLPAAAGCAFGAVGPYIIEFNPARAEEAPAAEALNADEQPAASSLPESDSDE